jgi:hypothetical protein
MDEEVWNHAVFSKNRERLLTEEIAEGFFRRVIERAKPFMSDEHFTVDGTLIEACPVVHCGRKVKFSNPGRAARCRPLGIGSPPSCRTAMKMGWTQIARCMRSAPPMAVIRL